MRKKPAFASKGLSLDTEDENNPLAQSIYSQIGPDGLKFLKDDLKVSKDGVTKISSGNTVTQISSLTKDDLEFGVLLGRGAAGQVEEGIYKPTRERVAIKSINAYDRDKRHQLMNDIKLLLQNKVKSEQEKLDYCPFLVKLYGAYFEEGTVKVVLELMDAGSLGDLLKRVKMIKKEEPYFEEPILAKITQQILNGLMYLNIVTHQIHRDIKPANILINTKGEVKLTDFGISKELEMTNQLSTTFLGTAVYMSPERLECKKYNHLSDIWSVGLMLLELSCGKFPYPSNKSYIEILEYITKYPSPNLPENGPYSKELRNFVQCCLEKDVKKRPSAIELLMHPWILKNVHVDVDLAGWVQNLKNYNNSNNSSSNSSIPSTVSMHNNGQKMGYNTTRKGNMDVIDEKDEMK